MNDDGFTPETDLDLLEAVHDTSSPIATTADVVEQLSASDDVLTERLKILSRNGLLEVKQYSGERG